MERKRLWILALVVLALALAARGVRRRRRRRYDGGSAACRHERAGRDRRPAG